MVRRGAVTLAVISMMGSADAGAATLFALVDTAEIFASTDAGATWEVRSAIPAPDAVSLVAAASTQELILTTGAGTVYLSPDAGVSWVAAGMVPASDIVDVAGRGASLYALSRSGIVWVSDDGGASFAATGTMTASDLVSLEAPPGGPLLAATRGGMVWTSTDLGTSWSPAGTVPASDVVALRAVRDDLYVLTYTGLTWRSTDAAGSWEAVGTASQVTMAGLAATHDGLTAATREGLVARSLDGSAWTWVGAVNQVRVTALADDEPQVVGVPEPRVEPSPLLLRGPWPNPLRPGSGPLRVELDLAEATDVRWELYDIRGRWVASGPAYTGVGPGRVALGWEPRHPVPGVYCLRIATRDGATATAPVLMLR